MWYQLLLHVWVISTTCVQNFFKIQWNNLHAKLYKNMMNICMCMFSCILCTSLHEEPPSLFMCASFHKKNDNNIGIDFARHDDMVINRVQTHSYTNQNMRPNIWVSRLLILVYMGFFAKSFICRFYTTISVIWLSLDHSKDNLKITTSFSSLTTS